MRRSENSSKAAGEDAGVAKPGSGRQRGIVCSSFLPASALKPRPHGNAPRTLMAAQQRMPACKAMRPLRKQGPIQKRPTERRVGRFKTKSKARTEKRARTGGQARKLRAPPKVWAVGFAYFSEHVLRSIRGARVILHTPSNVIPAEIAKALMLAGFEPTEGGGSFTCVFNRGPCTLAINEDATWVCRRPVSNIDRLCRAGYTFDSLLQYLSAFPRPELTRD